MFFILYITSNHNNKRYGYVDKLILNSLSVLYKKISISKY